MSEYDEGTFEMLWNCAYCGTEKLLGLTHRHCPVCGAKQDAEARYFPADEDKVAVEDHEYHGADKVCGSCSNPQSAKSTFCGNCGAPMDGSAEVKRVEDDPPPAPSAPTEKPKKKSSRLKVIVAAVVVLVIAAVAVVVLWKKEVGVAVTGHTWNRRIGIEVYAEVKESSWCDQMPMGAREISRRREVRSHKKVPDGEDCRTKRVDKGDGTYTQKRVCTTKYRKEPIYDDKCRYRIKRWVERRAEIAEGKSLAETPVWPVVKLARTGIGLGAEREGKRTETYEVHLLDSENKTDSCAYPMAHWAAMPVGSHWSAQKGVISGAIDCGSLVPAN